MIERSKRITISGRGYLDQQAYENFTGGNSYNHLTADDYRVPVISQAPVLILRSQDVTVRDLTVRNGRNWNVNVVGCDRVTLRHYKVLTPPACVPEFTDGIDVVSTDGLTIDGYFAYCNDNCFAWGNTMCFARRSWVGPIAGAEPLRGARHGRLEPAGQRHSLRRVGHQQQGGHSRHPLRELRFLRHVRLGPFHRQPGAGPQVSAAAQLRDAEVRRLRLRLRPRRALCVSDEEGADQRLELVNVAVDVANKRSVFEGLADGDVGRLVFRNVSVGGKKLSNLKEADIHVKNVAAVIVE